MGVITTKKSLVQLERLSTAAFCRRRLAVVAVRLRMAETLREACTFIEQARSTPRSQPVWDVSFFRVRQASMSSGVRQGTARMMPHGGTRVVPHLVDPCFGCECGRRARSGLTGCRDNFYHL
jgi:hypothetical protein